MRKLTAAGLVAALAASLSPALPLAAVAATGGRPVYVETVGIPKDWDVAGGARWLDRYTGKTTFKLAPCPPRTDCVLILAGSVPGDKVGWASPTRTRLSFGGGQRVTWTTTTITVDVAQAKRYRYTAGTRRWLIAHELGHWAGLAHQSKRVSFMYPKTNPTPPMTATAAERRHLAGR
ncbi:hypothetical protein [Micromonospora sp. KC213]|uniref:hypothetical protein n=1 Tax=Micromonospora sp. KC213 TaxID=2530378 RepID=UPI0010483DEA|nr:hypothetical protein [Micromonospora sp. KC213]TDC28697.1 hypothetical protein E1166_30430 [Micromonospora sp. KC213]